MAASTFAALFLAHVIADYVVQTTWMVINKRRIPAMLLHISMVFGAMCLVTLSVQPWFIVLAIAHLWIDIVKTYAMSDGFVAYISDQMLHVASVIAVALIAPAIWAASPLAGIDGLPFWFMLAGGVLFAMRGGQYAVAIVIERHAAGSAYGVLIGMLERAVLCAVLLGGWNWLALVVIAAKAAYLALALPRRPAGGRTRLWIGTGVSLGWSIAVAVPLALAMPAMQ